MSASAPHYLLYCEASQQHSAAATWSFVLQSSDGSQRLQAADQEPFWKGVRLELLSVIRGLEALDQPSRVTLVTSSRYVGQGLRYGLDAWRENGWQWERYGVMAPIKHGDLWRRLDHALQYHVVECRVRRGARVPDDLSQRFRLPAARDQETARADVDSPGAQAPRLAPGQLAPAARPAARLVRLRQPGAGWWRKAVAAGGGIAAAAAALLSLRAA